jgi:predicted heme/steroid binding protein/uncharacterized membrane protein
MKEFDPETLAQFNGKEGRPVYVAQNGKIFDVSASRLWKTGTHMNRHPSGRDLTADLSAAPHGSEILERYPQVGTLKKKEEDRALPGPLGHLLARFPFLRRHPHPMVVHFPIVFSVVPVLFHLLGRITGERAFETTALHCLAAGILFWFPAVLTGFFTWWLNYQARPLRAVRIKIGFSFLLVALALAAFSLRVLGPVSPGMEILYGLLLLSLVPVSAVIGSFGASLTFPVEKR